MSEQASNNNRAAVRESALLLLGRRDHSSKELIGKLSRRGFELELVESVLQDLSRIGLHSEQRYAESYARQRAMKAYGPLRIQAELAQRGLDRDQISQALDALEVDFAEQARAFYQRKYQKPVTDYREKARRSQAMARRGFSSDHLRGLFDSA